MKKSWISAMLAATWALSGAQAHAADNSCAFQSNGGLSLSFGTLNPANAVTVVVPIAAVSLNSDKAGDCNPAHQTMTISADNGLNFGGGSRRMRSASGDFIPYTLTAVPFDVSRPGNNRYATFTFNGQVVGTAYENAPAGSYTDRVTISVTP